MLVYSDSQVNLRAAPYDFRYGANSPTGKLFLQDLRQLIEDTYEKNEGRKMNIIAHRFEDSLRCILSSMST